MGPLPGTMYPFAGLHYKLAAHKYGLRPAKAGHFGHHQRNAVVPMADALRELVMRVTEETFTAAKFTRYLPAVVLLVIAQPSCPEATWVVSQEIWR